MPSLRFQVLAFTVVRTVLNTMHRMVYPFLVVFSRGLGVDLTVLSLALSGRSLVGVFTPFLASVADIRGRKFGMLFGVALFTAGVTFVVVRPTFPVFVAGLVFALVGKYVFDPSMQAYLGDHIAYQRRGRVLAITELGWSFSFIAGVPLVGFLIARGDWRTPFPVLALLGLASLAILSRLLPKDMEPPLDRPGLWRNLHTVLTCSPALAGLALGVCFSAGNEVVNLVFGVWMEDAFGLKLAALGAASAAIGLSELGGESLTAILTDRIGKPRAVGIGLALNSLAALVLPWLGKSLPGAVIGLFLFYLTFEFTLVSSLPMMTEILPAARATLMAANVAGLSLGRSLGALLATPIYSRGFWLNSLAAFGFDMLALLLLSFLAGRMAHAESSGAKSPPS